MEGLYLIPGLVCLFLGVVFHLVFRYGCSRQEEMDRTIKAQTWGRLTGKGSRTEYDYKNRSRTVYYGIYEYQAADGRHYSSASSFGYGDPEDIPGTGGNMVKILYDPNKPTEFALADERAVSVSVWPAFKKVGIILTVIGVLLTAVAAAALLGFFDPILGSLFDQWIRQMC